jgi:hypothetical protein
VFCRAFEYLARLRGGTLGRRRRGLRRVRFRIVARRIYDQQKLELTEYQALRSALRHIVPEARRSHSAIAESGAGPTDPFGKHARSCGRNYRLSDISYQSVASVAASNLRFGG